MKITGLYAGKLRPLGPKGSETGIFKQPVERARVNELGMADDVQADTRFHGGPEKALHQFSLAAYEAIIKRHPLAYKRVLPGSVGENITSPTLDDDNVCIGDIYQMGEVRVQVSSPRIPCWKIAARLELPQVDTFIQQRCITGWYYRVLESGLLNVGDTIELLARPNDWLSIKTFMQMVNSAEARPDIMHRAKEAKGLDPQWRERLNRKLA